MAHKKIILNVERDKDRLGDMEDREYLTCLIGYRIRAEKEGTGWDNVEEMKA